MTEERAGQGATGQFATTLGARLRQRREELGWSLADVESHLKMRLSTLQAIEGERYSELPDKVYALGFIKSYAQFLGLNVESVMRQAREELASLAPRRSSVHLDLPGPQEGRSAGLWVLLGVGLIVIIGGYAGWYHFYAHGRLSPAMFPQHPAAHVTGESETALPETASRSSAPPVAEAPHPAGEVPAAASGLPGDSNARAAEAQKDVPDLPPPPESVAPGATGSNGEASGGDHPAAGQDDRDLSTPATVTLPAEAPAAPVQAPVPAPVQAAPAHPAAPASNAPAAAGTAPAVVPSSGQETGDRVTIRALEDSWVHVVDASGNSLLGHVLKKGEVWQGAPGATYHVTSGNAGGVVLQAGNVVSAPLGPRGKIARDVVVSASLVEQGRYGHGTLPTGAAASKAPR